MSGDGICGFGCYMLECFKRLHLDKSAANIEDYKLAKRTAKRAVSATRHEVRGEGHL